MHNQLRYSADDDGEVFRQAQFDIEGIQVKVSAGTVQGSKDGRAKKPNEDAFSVVVTENSLIAAVFDGCSSQKPISWLTDQTGARFAPHFAKAQLEALREYNLKTLVAQLNRELFEVSSSHGGTASDVHSLPATTATILMIDLEHQRLSINHLGDTFCILFRVDGTSELITIDLNEKYDSEIFALINDIAKTKHITPREARRDPSVDSAIKDMFQKTYNTPDGRGQGLLNGDPVAEKYTSSSVDSYR